VLASRLHWRLLIGTILVLMAAAWLAPIWVRPPAIQENRILAPKPAWPHHLSEFRAFRTESDAYVADHFPIRPQLIGALNRLRMLVGVSGSKRVIIGRDGWLFYDDDTHLGSARGDPPMPMPETRTWLMALAGRTEALRARGIPYLVVAAPVKETIYPQFGPAWFPGPSLNRPTVRLARLAAQTGAGEVLYLHDPVAAATRAGQKTYSLHDTHWTGYGAYAGYAALLSRLHAMGITDPPKPMSDFEFAKPGNPRLPRDLALMLGVASFVHIDFPHIENPAGTARMTTTYLTEKQDWTAPQVVDTGEVGKPTLLMTRDSFSNELSPMLLPHFSRIVLAHNQDGAWRPDLIDRYKPDIVIIEVVEHGLRVSMGDAPAASPEAIARIDKVLSALAPPTAPAPPAFAAPTARIASEMAAAKPGDQCNFDVATLKPGLPGHASLSMAGWIWDQVNHDDTPQGLVRLQGPGIDLVAKLRVDVSRPDVGKAFNDVRAERTGFLADHDLKGLPSGAYALRAYRRSGRGWITCPARQALALP
jgi:acetyltransferase AlgX (SGNH hydrolase-like protein)